MGSFYANFTLGTTLQSEVARALTGRTCVVTPPSHGTIVVFDKECDLGYSKPVTTLGTQVSLSLGCPVLAVSNHDDDILVYGLYLNGKLEDEYDSTPDYFEPQQERALPDGGDAVKLCDFFKSGSPFAVEQVLRTPAFGAEGYSLAWERHEALVKALGISLFSVGFAFASFERGELPEGLASGDLLRTE